MLPNRMGHLHAKPYCAACWPTVLFMSFFFLSAKYLWLFSNIHISNRAPATSAPPPSKLHLFTMFFFFVVTELNNSYVFTQQISRSFLSRARSKQMVELKTKLNSFIVHQVLIRIGIELFGDDDDDDGACYAQAFMPWVDISMLEYWMNSSDIHASSSIQSWHGWRKAKYRKQKNKILSHHRSLSVCGMLHHMELIILSLDASSIEISSYIFIHACQHCRTPCSMHHEQAEAASREYAKNSICSSNTLCPSGTYSFLHVFIWHTQPIFIQKCPRRGCGCCGSVDKRKNWLANSVVGDFSGIKFDWPGSVMLGLRTSWSYSPKRRTAVYFSNSQIVSLARQIILIRELDLTMQSEDGPLVFVISPIHINMCSSQSDSSIGYCYHAMQPCPKITQ